MIDLLNQLFIVFLPPFDCFYLLKPVYEGYLLFKHDEILLLICDI